jgi:hypothetical protein
MEVIAVADPVTNSGVGSLCFLHARGAGLHFASIHIRSRGPLHAHAADHRSTGRLTGPSRSEKLRIRPCRRSTVTIPADWPPAFVGFER